MQGVFTPLTGIAFRLTSVTTLRLHVPLTSAVSIECQLGRPVLFLGFLGPFDMPSVPKKK